MGIPEVFFPAQVSTGIVPLPVGREENQFRLLPETAEPLPAETPGRGRETPESAAPQHHRWEFTGNGVGGFVGNGGVGSVGNGRGGFVGNGGDGFVGNAGVKFPFP